MTNHTYHCTDEASGGVFITMTGVSAEAVLAEYIADALRAPDSYNQGEDGISSRIRAYVMREDKDTGEDERAEGWIEFPAGEEVSADEAEARKFVDAADKAEAQRMERDGVWDSERDGWVKFDPAGKREGVHVTGTRPRGSGRDYRRAQEIVRRAR